MKIKDRNKLKDSSARTLLYALLGMAVLAVGVLPLYRALSQSKTDALAQASVPVNSLPTRLQINPDGSVRVSFQGKPGAVHQIYYTDTLPTSTDKAEWTLVAADVAAGSGDWTEWLDTGAAKRSHPTGANQGFYRVVLKSSPAANTASITSANDSTSTNAYAALKAMRKQETAEIMNIIAGGSQMESALVQRLADTPLTAEYILEVLKKLTPEQAWARKAILEAAVLLRPAQLKKKALARARLLLGGVYSAAQRYADAIQQFLEVARIQPDTVQGCEGLASAGRIYRLQGNKLEARHYLQQAAQFRQAGRWPEEAQWIIGLTYHEERDSARALEEFKKLAEWPEGGLLRAHGYYYMGEALRELGRWDEAYAAYRKVIALNRDLPKRSPFRSQYSQAEKWARAGWARIAPHLQSSEQTKTEGTKTTVEAGR